MPPSSSAPKKGAGKSRGGGGKESKGQIVLVLLLMTICVAIYHFRGIVFSFVLPKFVIKPRTGEGNGAVLGGEFELMGWANYLEKIGQGQDAARCCYSGTNLGDLHKSFCESDVDMLDDGLKILNECSENLRGRTEYPLTRFNAEHYQGNVKQNSRAPWIFYVKDIERQKRRGDKEEHKKGPGASAGACKILKDCVGGKKDKRCSEIKKAVGDC